MIRDHANFLSSAGNGPVPGTVQRHGSSVQHGYASQQILGRFGHKRCVAWQPDVADSAIVIGAFDTIHQRTSLNRHASLVLFDLLVRQDAVHQHGQFQFDHVPSLPLPINHCVAIDQVGAQRLIIHVDSPLSGDVVFITIKVAWQYLATDPAGYSQPQGKTKLLFW